MPPPDTILHFLEQYGYAAVFIAVMVEGPIATIIGGFVASLGILDVFAVFAIAALGDLCGDLLYYGLGRFGRYGAVAGLWHALGLRPERLARAAEYIERHGAKILLFAKYTQTGFLALPASGAARMPLRRFLWYNTLGTLPKSLVLVVVGFFFGSAYRRLDGNLAKASLVLFAALCLFAVFLLVRRYLSVRHDAC